MHEGELRLTPSERTELRDRMRSRTLPAEDVRRARLIVLLAQGKSYLAIRQVLGCNPNYISRWKGRFEAERLAGLYSHHPGRAVEKRTPALEAKILEWTRRPAPDGSTHSIASVTWPNLSGGPNRPHGPHSFGADSEMEILLHRFRYPKVRAPALASCPDTLSICYSPAADPLTVLCTSDRETG